MLPSRQNFCCNNLCKSVENSGNFSLLLSGHPAIVLLCGVYAGNALLRRLVRIGVLDESKMKLDYVLGLRLEDFLERRLQTQVFKLGLAKSIHHARVLIRQRHIRFVVAL